MNGARNERSAPVALFLTRSLNRGGAERQLVTLVLGLKRLGWTVSLACFYAGGPLQREVEEAGIPVFDLAKRGRWDVVGFLWRLGRLVSVQRPSILHGYQAVPNMLVLLLCMPYRRIKAVWGVRASSMDLTQYDWLARFSFWMACRLARFADLIIVNSRAGLEYHVTKGYPRGKMYAVSNGIDTAKFQFDEAGRYRLRREWNVQGSAILVGLIGRLDPMKDHATFLQSAAILARQDLSWRFVCVGDGSAEYTATLVARAQALGLAGQLIWAGPRDDMAAVYSALDIAVSSSYTEGFTNVVAEAMACGRAAVVTHVGDSSAIVGDVGVVVPPRNPLALAHGITQLRLRLEREGQDLRAAARSRIEEQFSVESLVSQTARALEKLMVPGSVEVDIG